MEQIKRWLRVIGVPLLFLIVGFGLGLLARGKCEFVSQLSCRISAGPGNTLGSEQTGYWR